MSDRFKNNDPFGTQKRRNLFRELPRSEHYLHLAYFAVVAVNGPYHYAAAVCFVVGILVLVAARK